MPVLDILTYPDSRLKQVAEEVSVFNDELQRFIDDLDETMRAGPGGVGIAATQVGDTRRIVIIDVPEKKKSTSHGHLVLINPEISEWEGMKKGREGCMSVPDYTGNVIRADKITLHARNRHGEKVEYQMQGFEARAVQHEIDHLDGLLFLDRLVSRRNDLFERQNYQ